MKIEVRYYSKTGNTKKLADAIANAVGVAAKTTDSPVDSETDILFLGSSVYAAGIDDEMKQFINKLDSKNVKKIVNFGTAALLPSTYKQVKGLAEKNGLTVAEEEFHCRGSFGALHKDRPNESDLRQVQEFAKKIIGNN